MSLLKVFELEAGYGRIVAVKRVSLSVDEGEIVTLIGANGAGKTTTLLAISQILKLTHGEVFFAGERIDTLPAHEIVQKGIAHVPEGRKIFPRLTVLENLELGAYTSRNKTVIASDLERVFTLFPILKDRRPQLGGTLSGGEQQMLAISRALMSKPKLLLLDEPSMGIAPILVGKIFEAIAKLNQEGMTVLLVEQNAHLALQLASRGYVIETGSIVMEDASKKLLSHPRVQEAYLGTVANGMP